MLVQRILSVLAWALAYHPLQRSHACRFSYTHPQMISLMTTAVFCSYSTAVQNIFVDNSTKHTNICRQYTLIICHFVLRVSSSRREHGIYMESDIAHAATERARHRALRMYRRPGTADQQQHAQQQQWGEVARRPTSPQLRQEMSHSHSGGVASIGSRGRESTIGGAFPPDRYRGHRIRCKAVLMSDQPNDIDREVRV